MPLQRRELRVPDTRTNEPTEVQNWSCTKTSLPKRVAKATPESELRSDESYRKGDDSLSKRRW